MITIRHCTVSLEFGRFRRWLRQGIQRVQLSLKLVVRVLALDLQRRRQASILDRQQLVREVDTLDHLEPTGVKRHHELKLKDQDMMVRLTLADQRTCHACSGCP